MTWKAEDEKRKKKRLGRSACDAGLVMNVVPGDGVLLARRSRLTDGEHLLIVECFVQQLKNFSSIFGIGEISFASGARIVPSRLRMIDTLDSIGKFVENFDRSFFLLVVNLRLESG